MRFESVVDAQIRAAQERGDFDNLSGAGKPLPRTDADDEHWWVTQYVRREGLPTDALLPTPLRLRREVERLRATVRPLPTEDAVRAAVADLNARIADWLRIPLGPQVRLGPVDVAGVVSDWQADRTELHRRAAVVRAEAERAAAERRRSPRRRWFRRGR